MRFLASFKKLLAKRAINLPRQTPTDEGVHFYPPRRKGIPAFEAAYILENHIALLNKIKITLGLTPEEYETLILPVIVRFTEFVHLLPASENHHHHKAGGLLRHSIETAFHSARHSTLVIWPTSLNPSQRREEIPRWQVTMFLAGLLHDLGKTVMDIEAIAPDGSFRWDPYHLTLLGWCKRNNHQEYYIRYIKDRGQDHSAKAMSVAHMVLPKRTIIWLRKTGPKIFSYLTDYLSGVKNLDEDYRQFCKIVADADSFSTSEDLKLSASINSHETTSQAVETFLIRAMKTLIDQGRWTVNEKGSRLWMLHDGLFIAWPQGGKDIAFALDKDLIPGIQRNPEAIANLMIERAIAIPYQDADKTKDNHWPFIPSIFGNEKSGKMVVLHGLKINNPSLLFGSLIPEPMDAIVGEKAKNILYERKQERKGTAQSKPDTASNNAGAPKKQPTQKKKTVQSTNQKIVLDALNQQANGGKHQEIIKTPNQKILDDLTQATQQTETNVSNNNTDLRSIEEDEDTFNIPNNGPVEDLFNEPAPVYSERETNETEISCKLATTLQQALRDKTLVMGTDMWVNSSDELCINAPDYLSKVFYDSTEETALTFFKVGYLSPFVIDATNLFKEDFASGQNILTFSKTVSQRLMAKEDSFVWQDEEDKTSVIEKEAVGEPFNEGDLPEIEPVAKEELDTKSALKLLEETTNILSTLDMEDEEENRGKEDQLILIRKENVPDSDYEIANDVLHYFMSSEHAQNLETITPDHILLTPSLLNKYSKSRKKGLGIILSALRNPALGWTVTNSMYQVPRSDLK